MAALSPALAAATGTGSVERCVMKKPHLVIGPVAAGHGRSSRWRKRPSTSAGRDHPALRRRRTPTRDGPGLRSGHAPPSPRAGPRPLTVIVAPSLILFAAPHSAASRPRAAARGPRRGYGRRACRPVGSSPSRSRPPGSRSRSRRRSGPPRGPPGRRAACRRSRSPPRRRRVAGASISAVSVEFVLAPTKTCGSTRKNPIVRSRFAAERSASTPPTRDELGGPRRSRSRGRRSPRARRRRWGPGRARSPRRSRGSGPRRRRVGPRRRCSRRRRSARHGRRSSPRRPGRIPPSPAPAPRGSASRRGPR